MIQSLKRGILALRINGRKHAGGGGVRGGRNRGSILVVVLWTLVMISYLAGDYLVHNRSKTGTAWHLTASFRRENAVDSLIELMKTDDWKAVVEMYTPQMWVDLTVTDISLRFRLDDERNRININTADEAGIRQALVDILQDSDMEEADRLADAVMDWRDPDDMVRPHGAEAPHYQAMGRPYVPADGAFKTMTELMLVRGITHDLFWGTPGKNREVVRDPSDLGVPGDGDLPVGTGDRSVLDRFTVFPEEIQRLSILIPLTDTSRLYMVLFLDSKQQMRVIERYTDIVEGDIDF